MISSLLKRAERIVLNLIPAYRGTGAWVTHASNDYRRVKLRVPLNLQTRNYVGTIFGGSMYGAVDPICMLMLIKNLGDEYIVWDKAASIRFKKPGRSTLYADFELTQEELDLVRREAQAGPVERTYTVHLVDKEGTVCAEIDKLLYIRRKDWKRPAKPVVSSAPQPEAV